MLLLEFELERVCGRVRDFRRFGFFFGTGRGRERIDGGVEGDAIDEAASYGVSSGVEGSVVGPAVGANAGSSVDGSGMGSSVPIRGLEIGCSGGTAATVLLSLVLSNAPSSLSLC